ncbi:competence protein ComK [Bacillus rubiinfantis]|uniref:competence protein ComK n=1 Tax=Bacillus rubiinfantis TaxID=1499680 RepID=UPI0005A8C640|nr:competence protein ComK [Bacillus rubiinfantis]
MNSRQYYIITPEFTYMTGFFDRNGNRCSVVRELQQTLIIERSPLEILADSIRCIGFDLKGAISTAKWILGDIPMCPVIVNPIHHICVFPTKSAKNDDTMWFNAVHILRTKSVYPHTSAILSNGRMIKVPAKLSSFNTKLSNADQLRKITIEMERDPITFMLEFKRDHDNKKTKRTKAKAKATNQRKDEK